MVYEKEFRAESDKQIEALKKAHAEEAAKLVARHQVILGPLSNTLSVVGKLCFVTAPERNISSYSGP